MNGRSPLIDTRRVVIEAFLAFVAIVVTGSLVAVAPAHAEPFGSSSKTTTVTHRPLARTVIDVDYVSAMGSNIVIAAGVVHHQGPTGWVPSQASPISVLQWSHERLAWETVATTTTTSRGTFDVAFKAKSGPQAYRFVRPVGKAVAAATSDVYSVNVTDVPAH